MSQVDLAYHRKFRSKTMPEYIGNDKMKRNLMAVLQGSKRPQVMLYTGHAGCGKTTFARLTAKEYLCENRDVVTGACCECRNCIEMDAFIESGESGYLSNVREVDVTDSNKKQDIEDLLEDASQPSFDGNWKVFILDECHMMTKTAQNRLLKNLEEPAEKVLILLCTTDPDMLLETIISRCQHKYQVTKPTRDELSELLARVCRQEGVRFEEKALSLVCVKADFVPRKSLVELEKIVNIKKDVTYDNALDVLDIIEDTHFFDFYTLLTTKPIAIYKYVSMVSKIKTEMSLKGFVESLLSFTKRGIYISNAVSVEALDKSEKKKYKELFSVFRAGELAFLLDLLMDMKNSQDIETKLLLLGYTGLRPLHQGSSIEDEIIPMDSGSVGEEKKESSGNYLQSITMTEEEKNDFVADKTKTLSIAELASRVGGTIVNAKDVTPNK